MGETEHFRLILEKPCVLIRWHDHHRRPPLLRVCRPALETAVLGVIIARAKATSSFLHS